MPTPSPGRCTRSAGWCVALGSNLGERMATLQGAVDALADTPDFFVTGVSPVYETEPVDAPGGLRPLPQRRRSWPTPRCPPPA